MRFEFNALQRDGRPVIGMIEAVSARSAHRELLKRGVRPTAIKPAMASTGSVRRRRISRRDYAIALKQLGVLIAGGVPVAEAVAALGDATADAALSELYQEVNRSLRRGEAFPPAFARSFHMLPPHIHRIVEAGDFTGRLGDALADAAMELEQAAKIRAELRQALLYPAFLVVFGVLAVLFIFLVVVPRFALMFAGKFDKLPLLSYVVISAGLWFREHLVLVIAAVVAVAVGVFWVFRHPRARDALADFATRLPVVRHWSREIEIARWAAVMARLLENRVPLIQCLELARSLLRRHDIQLRLGRVERDVRSGATLATALADSAFLTPAALAMISVGERSGSLPEMVRSLATLYDEAARNRSRLMLAVIEPVAILIIGAVIGVVAMAVFMAITSVNNVPGL